MTADYIQHSTIGITNMNEKPELEIAPIGVGIPRLDPYRRLLARFYEPLFLLKALGQTRGEHTPEPTNSDACMERRRRFLRNLAYVCDFKKGGDSCTAIGLENCQTGYCFWVASNKDSDEIITFLNKALGVLRGANSLPTSDLAATESDLTQLCTDFAIRRIKLEHKNFQREAARCISRLRERATGTAEQIIDWLQIAMNFVDRTELCKFAYDHRVSVYIGKLTTEALQEESISGPAGMRSCFALARHHILRLAHHIRAPKELVADSCHLGHLLQAHNVRGADPLPSVPPPVRDSHTNLRGILNRMYSTDGEEKKTVEDGLLYLNRASFSNIFEHFMEQYTLPGTQVHAEVQVLEHFYRRRLSFVDGDKFVACSKPACLCCELYFRHHPARMVVPSSHCKVWTRWSPPLVKEFTKNSTAAREQKQIMSKITQALRDQIIDQVLRRTQMSQWHPDSGTCVTEVRPLDSFNLLEGQGKICKNGEFVADSLDSTEGESEELVEDIDSDDGGVSIKV